MSIEGGRGRQADQAVGMGAGGFGSLWRWKRLGQVRAGASQLLSSELEKKATAKGGEEEGGHGRV